jgi:TRAP-type C4-dicarboxylate transport system permease small subunit
MPRPPTSAPDDPGDPLVASPAIDLKRPVDLFFKGVEAFMAVLLVAMVVMVLGNVILRYGFDTGISASEELSRTAFVWLTFIGAVVATREGTHLGVDSLLRRLSRKGQVAMVFVSESIVLVCCVLMLYGTWLQHPVNATTASLITGMPMIWLFGILYVASTGIGLLVLHKLWRMATGRATDKDIFGAAYDHPQGDAP